MWTRTEPTWVNRRFLHGWPVNTLIISPVRSSGTFGAGAHWGWIGCDRGWVTCIARCADSYICWIYRRGTKPPSMLSSKPPDSLHKNSDFTSQNTGVSELPPSVRLFVCVWLLTYLYTFSVPDWDTGPGCWDEPGECDLFVRVREPLGAAVRPPRPPGPGGALQAAAVFPSVPVLLGLRWVCLICSFMIVGVNDNVQSECFWWGVSVMCVVVSWARSGSEPLKMMLSNTVGNIWTRSN